MSRAYVTSRPDIVRVALIRDMTDELRQQPTMRNVGLTVRRALAVQAVDAALTSQQETTR